MFFYIDFASVTDAIIFAIIFGTGLLTISYMAIRAAWGVVANYMGW